MDVPPLEPISGPSGPTDPDVLSVSLSADDSMIDIDLTFDSPPEGTPKGPPAAAAHGRAPRRRRRNKNPLTCYPPKGRNIRPSTPAAESNEMRPVLVSGEPRPDTGPGAPTRPLPVLPPSASPAEEAGRCAKHWPSSSEEENHAYNMGYYSLLAALQTARFTSRPISRLITYRGQSPLNPGMGYYLYSEN